MKKRFVIIFIIVLALTGCTKEENTIEVVKEIDPNEVVYIKDLELEKIVREKINKESGDILAFDMEMIENLNINYMETPDQEIDGLEYAINLNSFSFRNGGSLKTLTPLSNLQLLEYLGVSYAEIENETANFNTPALEQISFTDTNISDCSFLKTATNVKEIYISDSALKDLNFVVDMDGLEAINVSYNEITDITALEDKTKLTGVTFHVNEISDISVLSTCVNLTDINIAYNKISDISDLFNLENLERLTAYEEIANPLIPKEQINTLVESGVTVNYHQ
jgi:hypothetical protein